MKYIRKEIKGTNGYTITQKGNVYNPQGKKLKQFINPCGYPTVIIDGLPRTVSYLVAKAFVDNPDNSICVGYKDGDFNNVNSENLYWYYEGDFETISDKKEAEKENEEYSESEIDFEVVENKKRDGAYQPIPVVEINAEGEIINRFKSVAKLGYGFRYAFSHNRPYKNKIYMKEKDYSKEKAIEYYNEIIGTKRKEMETVNKILEVDIDANIINEFDNIKQCANYLNVSERTIRNVLQGTYNYKYGDNYFIYKKDYSKQTTSLILKRLHKK